MATLLARHARRRSARWRWRSSSPSRLPARRRSKPTLGQSDRERGQGAAAAAASSSASQGRGTLPDAKSQRDRAAGRPRLAPVPPGHAALDRRHRHPRHARAAGRVLSGARHGADRSRALRPHDRALQRVRALRALDDRDLLHHPGDLRPQHHVRQAAAAAADRARGVHRLVAVGEIRAQLSELPVHPRRGADLPDVDRLEHPEPGRRRMAQAGRRHRRRRASAGLSLQRRPEDDLLDRGARRRARWR